MVKHSKGDAFVHEKTGSATMINLDGQWEHNFVDDVPHDNKKKPDIKPVRPVTK